MCEPTTMALMSAASSVAGHMQATALARAQNLANSQNFQSTTQLATEGAQDVAGQASDRFLQETEAATQKSMKIADDAAEYIAATTASKDTVQGNVMIALVQDAAAKKASADAAITRQLEFQEKDMYDTRGIAATKAKNRMAAAWKPDVEEPSALGLVINTGLGAMSAYNSAKFSDDLTINMG